MTNPESLPSTSCLVCHGTGTITHGSGAGRMYQLDCETCSGTGRIPATNTSEADYVHVSTPRDGCPQCRGYGFYYTTITSTHGKPQKVLHKCIHSDDVATPALQDEPEQDRYRPAKPKDPQEPYRPARPTAKRIEPLKPHPADELFNHEYWTMKVIAEKVQELITAHNESQGKQE